MSWPLRRTSGVLAAAVAVVCFGVVGILLFVGSTDDEPDRLALRGVVVLVDFAQVDGTTSNCSGSGGYSDFRAGTPVTVTDADGTIIAAAATRPVASEQDRMEFAQRSVDAASGSGNADAALTVLDGDGNVCPLLFEAEVPRSAFYSVEVDRRGKIAYSEAEMTNQKFAVISTLGT